MAKSIPPKPITTFQEYFDAAPAHGKAHLVALNNIILSVVPDAEPYFSYGIPSYRKHGGLVGMGVFKDHISLFMLNGSFLSKPPFDLSKYQQTKSAIHFSYKEKLPATIIKKIVKARLVENIAQEKIKAEKKAKK